VTQLVLAYSRDSDPASSKKAAGRANVRGQKATVLRELLRYEQAFGHDVVSIDADWLYSRHPNVQRSVWSSRLAGMRRAGLLQDDRSQDPITFRLTPEGRLVAASL
jgi:hypothetical protein